MDIIAPRPLACWRRVPSTGNASAWSRPSVTGELDLRRLEARGLLALLRRRADLSLRPGRPLAAGLLDGLHYLKGLDAEVHAIDRVREGPNLVLRRRKLSFGEAADLDARIRSVALELDGRARAKVDSPPGAAGRARPSRWATTSCTTSSNGSAAGTPPPGSPIASGTPATYGPLPFLPPECQNAVVLAGDPRSRGGADVRAVLAGRAVCPESGGIRRARPRGGRLVGRRLLQSRLIFLAGDDVLHQPVDRSRRISMPSAGRFRSENGR